jgi:hypothetical protein
LHATSKRGSDRFEGAYRGHIDAWSRCLVCPVGWRRSCVTALAARHQAVGVPERSVHRRTPIRRAGFRFVVVYLTLYSFATQIAGGLVLFPGFSFPNLGTVWPMREVTLWLATHVFHARSLVYTGTSGDTAFHWVQTFWLLIVSAVIATRWTARSGRSFGLKPDATSARADRTDEVVARSARLFFRFALASQMFYFGMAKVIPTQFPPPTLVTLVNPVGNLSPTDLLWTFVGASTPYQMFTGWAEVAAGVLLVVPQTAIVGALIALADMIQVLALNASYDVGLKQISFHLILIALFLLAADAKRLWHALVVDRPHSQRRWLVAQIAFGVYLLAMFTRLAIVSYSNPGGPGSPRSALYGIWDVARLSVDGEFGPPQLFDYDRRWRRVIFDVPDVIVFERLDDSFAHYDAVIDTGPQVIDLRKVHSRLWRSSFSYSRPGDDALVLDGVMDGHIIHVELHRVGFDVFRLLNGGFRWVRPPA